MTISNWYKSDGSIDSNIRANRTWSMILREPTEIVAYRDGVALDAQTVKLTFDNDTKWIGGDKAVGKSAKRELVIFGVVGHPVVADTDLQTGDEFSFGSILFGSILYEIMDVTPMPGGIQAAAQRKEG